MYGERDTPTKILIGKKVNMHDTLSESRCDALCLPHDGHPGTVLWVTFKEFIWLYNYYLVLIRYCLCCAYKYAYTYPHSKGIGFVFDLPSQFFLSFETFCQNRI